MQQKALEYIPAPPERMNTHLRRLLERESKKDGKNEEGKVAGARTQMNEKGDKQRSKKKKWK